MAKPKADENIELLSSAVDFSCKFSGTSTFSNESKTSTLILGSASLKFTTVLPIFGIDDEISKVSIGCVLYFAVYEEII